MRFHLSNASAPVLDAGALVVWAAAHSQQHGHQMCGGMQPRHSPADTTPVENRALLFSSDGGAAATSSSMDGGLEQAAAAGAEAALKPAEEPANAAPVVGAAEAGTPAEGPPAASATDVQKSEDAAPLERPGECWPWLQSPPAWL